jgi:cytochrome c biogenesis protein CcmG/thiol:disulfide interchange protein DsbE
MFILGDSPKVSVGRGPLPVGTVDTSSGTSILGSWGVTQERSSRRLKGTLAREAMSEERPLPIDEAPRPLGDVEEGPPKASRTRGMVVAGVILALVLAVAWVVVGAMGSSDQGQDPSGRAAPGFTLPALRGEEPISLSEFAGSPVVLNFWASWCGPCKDEAPILAAAERAWRDRGVVFLGVDTTDNRKDAIAFEDRYGIEYESVFDVDGELSVSYGVIGYPETFFIDADGAIHAKHVGVLPDAETLDSYISQIAVS